VPFFVVAYFVFCAIFTCVVVVCLFFSSFFLSFLLRLAENFVFLYSCVMTLYRAVVFKFVTNSWFIFIYKSLCYDKSSFSNRFLLLLVLFFCLIFVFFVFFSSSTSSYHVM